MPKSEQILIYRLGSIGDTIVSLPIINKIRQNNPSKKIIVLTNKNYSSETCSMESLLGESGIISEFITYQSNNLSFRELFNLFLKIRELKIDKFYYMPALRTFSSSWRDYLFFKLCGIKKLIGFPINKKLRLSLVHNDQTLERECCRLVRCFSALGDIDLNDKSLWSLHFNEKEKLRLKKIISNFSFKEIICLNMGGKLKAQDWGAHNWEKLIVKLNEKLDNKNILLMIVGAQSDRKRGERISILWEGSVLNLCGKLNPRESAIAISKATIFVGHDSGPIHLAESLFIPCVGIYGPLLKAKRWHPYGSIHKIIHNSKSIFNIEVNEVLSNIINLRNEVIYSKKKNEILHIPKEN